MHAKAICGCYRRDEAQDPETFAAGLAAVLMDYPADIVRLAADPRTGVVSAFPMGMPNVGQIRQFLEDKLSHRDKLQRLAEMPKPEFTRLPKPSAGPGDLANVFVPVGTPMYDRFVERAKDADPREYRYDEKGRAGIFVALGWFHTPAPGPKGLAADIAAGLAP
jgi:hypothetical protein